MGANSYATVFATAMIEMDGTEMEEEDGVSTQEYMATAMSTGEIWYVSLPETRKHRCPYIVQCRGLIACL